jgi:hypothetical protein
MLFRTRKIFWDYKRSFIGTFDSNVGLPLVMQMSGKIMLPVVGIFGSLFVLQYLLTSSVYYDEYDGTVVEKVQKAAH